MTHHACRVNLPLSSTMKMSDVYYLTCWCLAGCHSWCCLYVWELLFLAPYTCDGVCESSLISFHLSSHPARVLCLQSSINSIHPQLSHDPNKNEQLWSPSLSLLSPAKQRRLRHLRSIAARNIVNKNGSPLLDTYFTLHLCIGDRISRGQCGHPSHTHTHTHLSMCNLTVITSVIYRLNFLYVQCPLRYTSLN